MTAPSIRHRRAGSSVSTSATPGSASRSPTPTGGSRCRTARSGSGSRPGSCRRSRRSRRSSARPRWSSGTLDRCRAPRAPGHSRQKRSPSALRALSTVPVELQDERLSTVEAERGLCGRPGSRARVDASVVDETARPWSSTPGSMRVGGTTPHAGDRYPRKADADRRRRAARTATRTPDRLGAALAADPRSSCSRASPPALVLASRYYEGCKGAADGPERDVTFTVDEGATAEQVVDGLREPSV